MRNTCINQIVDIVIGEFPHIYKPELFKKEEFFKMKIPQCYNNDTEYITLEKDKIPEISFICQRVKYIKNIIDENIEQDKSNEIERNKEKENYVKMQKKKHNNSKKLIDYIMTPEEAAKEREKELQQENNNDFSEDFIIRSKKKKKKLIKKNQKLDLIEEEDAELEEKSKNNSDNKKNIINDE